MSTPEFVLGQSVTLEADFKVHGALTDPTTVTLTVTDPSGNDDVHTLAGGTVTRIGTGQFAVTVEPDERGTWTVEWAGTGTVVYSKTDRFQVI